MSDDTPLVVLFASLSHVGQFNPMLAIAESFARQNNDIRVVFATSENRKSAVNAAGLDFFPAWDSSELSIETRKQFNAGGIRNADLLVQSCKSLIRSEANYCVPFPRLEKWALHYRPALIVSDILTEAPVAVALRHHIPYVVNTPVPPYFSFPESLPRLFPPVGSGTSIIKTSLWHRIYDFFASARYGFRIYMKLKPIIDQDRAAGVPTPEEMGNGAVAFLNCTSPLISDPRAKLPPKVKWVGTVLSETSAKLKDPKNFAAVWNEASCNVTYGALYSWMDEAHSHASPIVLISLGSVYELDAPRVHAIYEALSHLPVHVLWKLSRNEQAYLPHVAISNDRFRFVSWVPDMLLLVAHPGVKLHINHGGANTLHEALYFGKPQVCLPAWLDCFDFAIRLQDAGAGCCIDSAPRLDASELYAKVKEVVFDNKRYATCAEKVGHDLDVRGGATAAAAIVKEALITALATCSPDIASEA